MHRLIFPTFFLAATVAGCPQSQPGFFANAFDGDWHVTIPELHQQACLQVRDGRITRWTQDCNQSNRNLEQSQATVVTPDRVVWSYEFTTTTGRILVSLDATRDSETTLTGILSIFTLASREAAVYDVLLERIN